MSTLNPSELQKWKPRQPSSKLYHRIFGHAPQNEIAFHFHDFSRWLVPAFGCFLLVLGSLSNHLPARYSLRSEKDFVLPPLSEESSAAILPGAKSHSGVNSYPAKSYELSFGTRVSTAAATTASSILISYTNKLIQ
jgi:hypothetical protein